MTRPDDTKRSFCMVTTFYPPYNFGGDGIYVYRLAHALGNRGHRVTVIHDIDAYRVLGGPPPDEDVADHPNVTVESLRNALGVVSPLLTYLTGEPGPKGASLSEIFEREPFDVVHFHNVSLVGGPGVVRYGSGIKLYSAHEYWLICPMHILVRYRRELCPTPNCLRCSLTFRRPPQLWRYGRRWLQDLSAIDAFIAPSRFSAELHRERGFPYPMRYLPPFVPDSAEAAPADVRADRPYFLFVGRLEAIKGLQTLIEVFRGYDRADLVVAGEGVHADALRDQAEGMANVRFLGHVPFTNLRALYAGAIALLVPSIWYEVFGVVALEAFAQRTPVIAREIGGLTEMIHESGGGLSYRTDDELIEAMEALQGDPERRRGHGERGHDAFRRLWSEEAHLRGYFALIDELRARVPT